MSTDPAYVAEQTGLVISATMTEAPLEPLLADARGRAEVEWRPASGRGVVYSVTVVRRPFGEYR